MKIKKNKERKVARHTPNSDFSSLRMKILSVGTAVEKCEVPRSVHEARITTTMQGDARTGAAVAAVVVVESSMQSSL